ncbi:ATP-NAD kinase-like domain-containing protein [Podospora australis]|uniref:ATP-NAD kinase-like domain-containing protein n=1 Tax=Podospora australis TaxID=1536484 RepID=A0AAN6X417_9PEZI|nr:ATP-NAD kinase-like domain-containing protein [Podospora australis]
MTHKDPTSKQVSFEDGTSSASDEDRTAVEVVFDSANPYRRKSSLVGSEYTSAPPYLRSNSQTSATQAPITAQPSTTRFECIVHQFLESHKQRPSSSLPHHAHPHHHAQKNAHDNHNDVINEAEGEDISDEAGLNRPLDPKGPDVPPPDNDGDTAIAGKVDGYGEGGGGGNTKRVESRCRILPMSSSASETDLTRGQLDELSWRSDMLSKRTPSQMDLASANNSELNSRLLTKKQLSEMAWGVRELSRRLGSVRLKFKVKTIFLLTKIYDVELIAKTKELTRWLLDKERDVRYTVYVDRELKDNKRFDAAGLVEEVKKDFVDAGECSEEASEDVGKRLRFWTEEMCRARPHTFDFVITLGGDGTVLYASWLFQRIVPPVLSFALGSLGFLTKFDFEEYQKTLTAAFSEGVTVSLRLRFEVTVMRSQKKRGRIGSGAELDDIQEDGDGDKDDEEEMRDLVEELIGEEKDDEHTHRPEGTFEVLNELVVDRGPNPSESSFVISFSQYVMRLTRLPALSNIEIFGDDEYFTSVSADGVCVSTPTGSTAYNLAAGGSLCHPENPVMLLTSICAHTLSFRPIILPDTIVLRIGVPYDARTSSWASFDGRERVELRPGDYVTVSASRYPFACVQAHGKRSEEWIRSISAKLGWNVREKQKPLKEWKN